MSSLVGGDTGVVAMLSWSVGFPSLVLVSYLAARMRPGAAIVFTVIIAIAVVVQLIVKGHDMSMWKQIAALLSVQLAHSRAALSHSGKVPG